jgi:phosphoglycolate phosphatase
MHKINNEYPGAIIFDLDGTLINSAASILRSLEEAIGLVLSGWDQCVDQSEIGPPINEIIVGLLPECSLETRKLIEHHYRNIYDARGALDVQPYEGVLNFLMTAKSVGTRIFIVTNKPKLPTANILRQLKLDRLIEKFVSPDSVEAKYKNKVESVLALMYEKKLSALNGGCILVGDSIDDAEAAYHAKLPFVAVAFGYGDASSQIKFPIAMRINCFNELNDSIFNSRITLPLP